VTDRLPGEDPGWGPLGKVVLGLFLPWLAIRRAASASSNALVTLRSVFLAFALAQVFIGVVVLFLVGGAEGEPELEPEVAAGAVLVIGTVLVLVSRTLLRQLPCTDLGRLVGAYRTRFFLRLAFAESSTLLGFVGSLLSDSALPYLAGLVPAAIGFARLAPTRGNLQREDDALLAQGCAHSLYGALAQATLGPQPGAG
jgi:F0F1-type ATP synthase membrane subunit c/vacuolar-type H+-ATPase subunit K